MALGTRGIAGIAPAIPRQLGAQLLASDCQHGNAYILLRAGCIHAVGVHHA